ncbi:TolB amino-terminal domain-containing protein [Rhizobiales bacterium GAS188]|nr:TolB amino-terminal domain-containing protein [Rhizobiales bacterium GAS188]
MMQEAAAPRVERRLAAIMAADVVGYSRLMGADEEGTLARLKAHRRELGDPKIREHRGRIVKTTGDGMLVEFVSPVEAVRCAVEIQRGMVTRNSDVPEDQRITFRMGINLGDVIAEKGDLFGDGVNVAARLESLCEPGGVSISRTVRDQIRDKLPFVFADAGEHEVKNIARPVRVYALTAAAIEALPEAQPMGSPQGIGRRSVAGIPVIAIAALASLIVLAGGFWWLHSSDITPSRAVVSATADKQTPPAALITAVAPSAALAKLAAPTAPRMSIVVLPFTNLSGDPSQEYFADGFTEDLTTDLSRISGSFVIARTTAYTYKGKALSGKEIASELGVRYVLEGGVQRASNHVRVNAQLIDGETGAHLWAERYDRDSADFLQMQDEITNQIASALNITLSQSEANRSWRDHPSNPDSVDLTLRANALIMGLSSQEANAKARRLYEQAVELDPKNVDALVGLAWTYTTEFGEGWSKNSSKRETLKGADDALTRALAIAPGSAAAYHVKSEAFAYDDRQDYRGEIVQAIAAAETSLALNPNGARTHAWLGRLYAKAGHPERTSALVGQAIRLSPHDPLLPNWLYTLGMSQLQMGDNGDAIKTFQKSVLLGPRKVISWAGLTGAFYAAGRDREAHDALIKWREIGVSEAGQTYLDDPPDKEILDVRVELALLRLGRWPYTIQLSSGSTLWKALFRFQADENLPQTGKPDEATLARLGITSQARATPSK